MSYETLAVETDGPVLRVWLDRPHRRNAVDPRMLREIGDLFLSLDTRFDLRAIVLGGRGASFCAGADRKPPEGTQPSASTERERRWVGQLGRRACRAIEDCEIPTVARVQGHAIGGGCCLALSCDFRVATRDARFRLPEVELGVPLSWSGTPRLIHEIGAARAREMLLLCEEFDAASGERFGLVHRAVEPAALDGAVQQVVDRLLALPELSVHQTKTQLRGYSRRAALGDASEADGDQITVAYDHGDARQRMRPDAD